MTSLGEKMASDAPDARGTLDVELHVNGELRTVAVRPTETLLETLRERFRLYGAREGCGVGMCGACTVLLDGQPVSSCLMLTFLAGRRAITTIEGLAPPGELHPVQESFVEHTGFQCSYCTPGFVLTTVALLASNHDPSRAEAREYLSGNLCRCGSYVKILDSVMSAKERLRAVGQDDDPGSMGEKAAAVKEGEQ
jgi:aerobic-type carbon monoxide dehydrogenase small subunit (CoxS/CutS family)